MAEPHAPSRWRWLARSVLLPGAGLLAGYWLSRPRTGQPVTAGAPPLSAPCPLVPAGVPGAFGSGGYHAVWDRASPDAAVAHRIEYQYAGIRHQDETAISGMWLFLATELLFFGPLFLVYALCRSVHPVGFAVASSHAELLIGTLNTVLLLTSSAVFSVGLESARRGNNRWLLRACVATMILGISFVLLKGYEWMLDLDANLFPGPTFSITGPDAGGAQIFWSFYFVATGLHGLHMIIGIGLVAWIGWSARRRRFSSDWFTPVEAVGLYWSFVDMIWLVLYPTIYLVGQPGS